MEITMETIENSIYYSFDKNQSAYLLTHDGDSWGLNSRRKALSGNMGTFRRFKTLKEIESSIKSLKGISLLIGEN